MKVVLSIIVAASGVTMTFGGTVVPVTGDGVSAASIVASGEARRQAELGAD
jgi:hypothetical protein